MTTATTNSEQGSTISSLPSTETQHNYVPNKFPTLQHQTPYRIAIIGEAPGADEVVAQQPFVGMSGRWLDYLLNRTALMRTACYLGNVSQHRPKGNDISNFSWTGPEIQGGIAQLGQDLQTFNPNLCLLLGASALRAAKGHPESITNWRGSLFLGAEGTPFAGRKCLATYHPASSLRVYEQTPLLLFDLKRARTEGETRNLNLPQRTITVARSVQEVEEYVRMLQTNPCKIGTDIEGYVDNLTCISFAHSPLQGFVVPFTGPGGNYWNEVDELQVWLLIKELLEDRRIAKVLQNGLYDRFVLAYTYGILINNVTDDTLVKHWELYCELKKSLAVQASIYTKEPYYKDERGSEGFEDFWKYNGKDSCVTLEISNVQDAQLPGGSLEHYQFNMQMQDVLLYMELRGMLYDIPKAAQEAKSIREEVYRLQHTLNRIANCPLAIQTEQQAIEYIKNIMCLKKARPGIFTLDQIPYNSLKAFQSQAIEAVELCKQGFPFDAIRNGHLSMLCETYLNTNSSQQLQAFLYTNLGMPIQTKRGTETATTDATALLKLFKKTENPVLKLILKITNLRTQLETLEVKCDPDGRIRCGYNIVGTETGRLSCKQSPTRSGYNLQTVTKKQRHLFRADAGKVFFQCDLSGADGWTVAAHCKRLGDPTMYDDYMFGLKPAKLIALTHIGHNIASKTREELKELSKLITEKEPNKWLYMASKRVFHGDNYEMKERTMSDQILSDSWKYGEDIQFVEPSICKHLALLKQQRYFGVQGGWHRWIRDEIKNHKQLKTSVGQVRKFFGRPTDHDTFKQALAHEPQLITTYATNTAVLRLWNDRENRNPDGSLIIEPLHQVHDALCGQSPDDKVEWAKAKIRSWFHNTILIAGTPIIIPFEGGYGKSWGELENVI